MKEKPTEPGVDDKAKNGTGMESVPGAERANVIFDYISILSHELKAPLSVVEGYLYMLEDPSFLDDKDTVVGIVKKCEARLEGARQLLSDVVYLMRLESGITKREFEDFNLTDAARDAIAAIAADAQLRCLTIDFDAADSIPVRADRSEIDIILGNLLSNAVKFNRDNGRVKVHIYRETARDEFDAQSGNALERSNDTVVIEVTDTGIGLSKEDTAKLFKDFVRIKNKKTSGIIGTGLGLSIVKKLAILNGGNVSVESEPDLGSTFTVRIRAEQ